MEEDEKIIEYLKRKNCRGCGNRCPLNDPMCGRSGIFIDEAMEKYDASLLD